MSELAHGMVQKLRLAWDLGMVSPWKPRRFGRKPMKSHERATGFFGGNHRHMVFHKKLFFRYFS
jgi:hypothetical protein